MRNGGGGGKKGICKVEPGYVCFFGSRNRIKNNYFRNLTIWVPFQFLVII